ncbi:MAG: hypothetical protein U0Y68_14765 [Blastocatellia bacterium]
MKLSYRLRQLGLCLTFLSGLALTGLAYGKLVPPTPAIADAIALLPASDGVAVVDVARMVNELLPQLRALAPAQAVKFEKEINEFRGETGIDPYRIKSAVVGFKMAGGNNVSAVIDGITFDPNRLLTSIKAKDPKQEVKTIEYKGKQVFVVTSAQAEKAGLNEDMAFTQLDSDRVALGNLSSVKSVLDGGNSGANSALSALLAQTNDGLLRFATNLPENAKKGLAEQGDMFAQFATIKTVFGSLDLTRELSLLLDTKLRTNSNDEAAKLQSSLSALVGLGKMFLGGNNDPAMAALMQVIDLVKINAQSTDVAVSLTVPKSVFDRFAEAEKKKEQK